MSFTISLMNNEIILKFINKIQDDFVLWKFDPYHIKSQVSDIDIEIEVIDSIELGNVSDCLIYQEQEGFYQTEIFQCGEQNIWLYSRKMEYRKIFKCTIDQSWKYIKVEVSKQEGLGRYVYEYVGKILAYAYLNYQSLALHGTLMEYKEQGIILSAPSGTGKTTHARLWRDYYNAIIINGDCSLCSKQEHQWMGHGTPWCGTSGENINRHVPIKAIVILEQAEENKAMRLDYITAYKRMLHQIHAPLWNRAMMNKALDIFEQILTDIPVILLKCRPDKDAVDTLKHCLEIL